jgi:hypothetical protein
VEDAVADPKEAAQAGELTLELGGPVVVLGRHDRLVQRDAEVVVEIAAVGGVPGDGPALLRLVALELLYRRAGHVGERGVADVQVLDEPLRDLVDAGGAAGTAVLPGRIEHEVADDQLMAPVEHVEQRGWAVGTLEPVVLLDLDHRQPPALGAERVPAAGQLLLLGEQLLARCEPLIPRDDLWKAHPSSPRASGVWVKRL